jgi:hypothetical protein
LHTCSVISGSFLLVLAKKDLKIPKGSKVVTTNRQYNSRNKKDKNSNSSRINTTQETKGSAKTKTRWFMCFGKVSGSCSISGNRRITLFHLRTTRVCCDVVVKILLPFHTCMVLIYAFVCHNHLKPNHLLWNVYLFCSEINLSSKIVYGEMDFVLAASAVDRSPSARSGKS